MYHFTYNIISQAKFDQMLGMENSWYEHASEYSKPFIRINESRICDGPDVIRRDTWSYTPVSPLGPYSTDTTLRCVFTTHALEFNKEYDIIMFPKTCSLGFCFVNPTQSPKQ